jgi:hypothetical protein
VEREGCDDVAGDGAQPAPFGSIFACNWEPAIDGGKNGLGLKLALPCIMAVEELIPKEGKGVGGTMDIPKFEAGLELVTDELIWLIPGAGRVEGIDENTVKSFDGLGWPSTSELFSVAAEMSD